MVRPMVRSMGGCTLIRNHPIPNYFNLDAVIFITEKGYGEHQLSPCLGDEEWQVYSWVSLHHKDTETGEGQVGYPSQQCPSIEASLVPFAHSLYSMV